MTTKKCIYCKRLQTIVDYYLTLFDPRVAAMARGANKSTRLRILNSLTSTWRGGGGLKFIMKKKQKIVLPEPHHPRKNIIIAMA